MAAKLRAPQSHSAMRSVEPAWFQNSLSWERGLAMAEANRAMRSYASSADRVASGLKPSERAGSPRSM
jgi:hypothetical protein